MNKEYQTLRYYTKKTDRLRRVYGRSFHCRTAWFPSFIDINVFILLLAWFLLSAPRVYSSQLRGTASLALDLTLFTMSSNSAWFQALLVFN